MDELARFKEIFWDSFHRPKLDTEKYTRLWESLEPINNGVAGPFYSIYSDGHCDYIFQDKQRFPLINNIDDFLDYTEALVRDYQEEVMKVLPETEEEKKDRQILLYQTDVKMELVQLAYQILEKRFNPQDKG